MWRNNRQMRKKNSFDFIVEHNDSLLDNARIILLSEGHESRICAAVELGPSDLPVNLHGSVFNRLGTCPMGELI